MSHNCTEMNLEKHMAQINMSLIHSLLSLNQSKIRAGSSTTVPQMLLASYFILMEIRNVFQRQCILFAANA